MQSLDKFRINMRKIVLYGVIIFQIILIISLVRGIQLSMRTKERITSLEGKKQQLENEAKELKTREEYVESPYYLEKGAREELQLSKPGETVVIVPDIYSTVETDRREAEDLKEKANWQKWWDVLSGNQ